jgi:ketosteroid isomerase-like protein
MKTIFVLAAILALVMSTTNAGWAESEEAKVQHMITAVADAVTAFPHTKDHQSVLKFFMKDFSSVDDMERGSIQTLENSLAEIEKDLAKESLIISEQISHIAVHVFGTVAWATYDDVLTIARPQGTAKEEDVCTAIFRKTDRGWLYQHEHCSAYLTHDDTELEDGSRLTRGENSAVERNSAKLIQSSPRFSQSSY